MSLVRQAQQRSATRPSRARRCSARCAATRTSSWCTGSPDPAAAGLRPAPHRRATSRSTRRALAQGPDRGARPAAARRDLDHRPVAARRGGGRARLGLRHADVRRDARCAPATCSSASLKTPSLRNALPAISREFDKVKVGRLTRASSTQIVGGSPEDGAARARTAALRRRGAGRGQRRDRRRRRWASRRRCKQFSVDLTERARKGEIDPIVGRDEEIRQIVDILMRRRQNNPILTGEAGVGQDGGGRGLRAAHRRRRRAAAAQGRQRCARSTSACCRPAPA